MIKAEFKDTFLSKNLSKTWLDGQFIDLVWRGSQSDMIRDLHLSNLQVVTVSGRSLERVRQHCTGIPMHDGDHVTWHGESAQFVLSFLIGSK